jgi:predicted outer membrane repeat protein
MRRRASVRAGIAGGGALALALAPVAAAQAAPVTPAGKTYEVTNRDAANVPGSLAYEISQANENASTLTSPNVITFASDVTGTIDLKQPLPNVEYSLDIKGPGARVLMLDASGLPNPIPPRIFGETRKDDARAASGRDPSVARKGDLAVIGEGYSVLAVDSKTPLALAVNGLSIDDASGGSPFGGAIYADDAELTLTHDSFTNDRSRYTGGAVNTDDSELTVTGSTFADNYTGYPGGAIYAYDSLTTIKDSTFVGNTAGDQGGAIWANDATIIDSTINGNESGVAADDDDFGAPGGGLWDAGSLTLEDSIAAGNTAAGTPDDIALSSDGDTLSAKFSLIEDATGLTGLASSDITGKDPKLGVLKNNGGSTDTELPQADSPVINAGKAFGLSTDQRGLARTVEFPNVANAPGSGGTDIGAVELQPYISSIGPRGNQPGQTVKIVGSGFNDATAIYFGKKKAKTFKVVNDTEITVTLPRNGKGRYAVRVVTPEGTSPLHQGGGEYTYL